MDIIASAHAAEGAPAAQGGDMSMLIVLTLCMVAVYFFVMRPNSKKRKEMQNLLNGLAVGDEVLTNGGIAGRITKLPDNKEYVLIDVGGITMQIKRNYVVAVLPKGTLVATGIEQRDTRRRQKKSAERDEQAKPETEPQETAEPVKDADQDQQKAQDK